VPARPSRWPLLRVAVAEQSMLPTLHPGDWLLARRTRRVRPGQLVLAWHPGQPGLLLVKRAAWRVEGDGEVGGGWWLASDNPAAGAVDSARFGPVPQDKIVAVVLVRYWPLGGPPDGKRRHFIGRATQPHLPGGRPPVPPDVRAGARAKRTRWRKKS
jgi:nickel-type superoxide dismutase maturation protease